MGLAAGFHDLITLNTTVEALELAYPLRVERYELRGGSGGKGRYRGGMGIRRDIRVLGHRAVVSLLADRRARGPWGLEGGDPGAPGEDYLIIDGEERRTPSGGGYGTSQT